MIERGTGGDEMTSVARGSATNHVTANLATMSPENGCATFFERQEELEAVGRDLVTTALVSCDPAEDVAGALASFATRLGVRVPDLARALLDRALGDPRFSEMAPRLALRGQLDVFVGVVGVGGASLWAPSRPGSVACVASSSAVVPSRRLRVLARATIEDDAATISGTRSPILGVPVRRSGASHGTFAVTLPDLAARDAVEPLADLAARRVSALLERQFLLEHGDARAMTAGEKIERRLVRTAFDLHDGPVQALAVLADEVRLVAADVTRLVPESCRSAVTDAFGSVHEQAATVERELREIAQSLETSAVVRRPLVELLEREAAAVSRRSGIEIVVEVRANVGELTDSQRIVLYRGIQEALSNVARHSGARAATVAVRSDATGIAVTIDDDGCGFDSARLLPAAAKRGRLGFVGIAERVRLLGGSLTVHSVPGSGTRVKIALPAWSPLAGACAHSS
jgi:signal transduction histidine kinase